MKRTFYEIARAILSRFPRLKRKLYLFRAWLAHVPYNRWIWRHIEERKAIYGEQHIPSGRFSIVTTIYNTKAEYLKVLAESLRDMAGFEQVEWVILDNGCSNSSTLEEIDAIRAWSNVRLFRVPENIGIINGMRFCLEKARGQYILPVDSDDYLYPDTLQILERHIELGNEPPLLYSDEDKLLGSDRVTPYKKPDWDPVLFYHSCYIAHLCCIDRIKALSLGTYTNERTNGSHDWDTFSRFHCAGYKPYHVPEILYSWRMHNGSTAANINSKDYILSSHREVLGGYVRHRRLDDQIQLDFSPLFNQTPDWRFCRLKPADQPWTVISWGTFSQRLEPLFRSFDGLQEVALGTWSEALSWIRENSTELRERNVLLVHNGVISISADTLEEAETMFHLFPDVACVSGRVIGAEDLLVVGDVQVRDGMPVNIYKGYHKRDYGYFAQALKPHSVDAASPLLSAWIGRVLVETVEKVNSDKMPFEVAAYQTIKDQGQRAVFDPLIQCSMRTDSPFFNHCLFTMNYDAPGLPL